MKGRGELCRKFGQALRIGDSDLLHVEHAFPDCQESNGIQIIGGRVVRS